MNILLFILCDIIVSLKFFHGHTYREESSRLRPLRHRGFHYKYLCNKRLKQFVRSGCQLQIDQVILCLKLSVKQQGLHEDKKIEGRCCGVYFKRLYKD